MRSPSLSVAPIAVRVTRHSLVVAPTRTTSIVALPAGRVLVRARIARRRDAVVLVEHFERQPGRHLIAGAEVDEDHVARRDADDPAVGLLRDRLRRVDADPRELLA